MTQTVWAKNAARRSLQRYRREGLARTGGRRMIVSRCSRLLAPWSQNRVLRDLEEAMRKIILAAMGILALAIFAGQVVGSAQAGPLGSSVAIGPGDAQVSGSLASPQDEPAMSPSVELIQLRSCLWYHESGRPCRYVWSRASGRHREPGCRCINPRDAPRTIRGRINPDGSIEVRRPCPADAKRDCR